jgi:hypothetical protein
MAAKLQHRPSVYYFSKPVQVRTLWPTGRVFWSKRWEASKCFEISARKMERDFGLSMAHGHCIQPAANWRLNFEQPPSRKGMDDMIKAQFPQL